MKKMAFYCNPTSIQYIVSLYENNQLNLNPVFQRGSVWKPRDRKKLIESILLGYPIPAIFFYKSQTGGVRTFDVIDGKQRIESILRFMGKIRGKKGGKDGRFSASVMLSDDQETKEVDWTWLCRNEKQIALTDYSIPTIEVDGELDDIINLFVCINSTGKVLKSAEKRHAKYYNSEFLRESGKLASRYKDYFIRQKILSDDQISQMKHVELICELMVSIHQEDVINKKTALDSVMNSKSLNSSQIAKAREKTVSALNRVIKIFPDLRSTRFRKISDFYSLVMLIYKFEREQLILTDRKRNRLAWDLLVAFSTGVDAFRDLHKKMQDRKQGQETFRDYLLTVTSGTDEITNRRKREIILRDLFQTLFERKDENRLYSEEQRRILWNSTDDRKCNECGEPVTWTDFTVDHIRPFSKGGQTDLKNAAIAHRTCNSSRGNRLK